MYVQLLFPELRLYIIHKKIIFMFYLTFVSTAKIKQHEWQTTEYIW
jgi:hypothetical protein